MAKHTCIEICPLPAQNRVVINGVDEWSSEFTRQLSSATGYTSVLVPEILRLGINADPTHQACRDMENVFEFSQKPQNRLASHGTTSYCPVIKMNLWSSARHD